MFKWAVLLPAFFCFFILSFVFSPSASAASAYDNLEVLDNIYLISPNLSKNEDVTFTYFSIFEQCSSSGSTAFSNAMSTGNNPAWYVTQNNDDFMTGMKSIVISWTDDVLDTSTSFITSGTIKSLVVNANSAVWSSSSSIYLLDNGTYDCTWSSGSPPPLWSYNSAAPDNWTKPFFAFNVPINYPLDFEGDIIPSSPPLPPLSDIPDMNVVNVVDWNISLQDRNFNTFDAVPFTCNDGLTPIIQYDLFNDDTSVRIDQGVFSPTIPYEFQSEKYGVDTRYKFIGNYYCGDESGQPTFSGQSTFYFDVSSSGLFIQDIQTGCITQTFPYIDIENCLNNMADTINLLTFNRVTFPGAGGGGGGGWRVDESCRTMVVLDDWIGSPGQVLCPMFPSYVRNIVTPFVTLLLGLLMLKFLTRQTGSGF